MTRLNYIRELQALYRGYTFAEIEEMFQIASAELIEVKRRIRDGIAPRAELRDAQADFLAIRGLHEQATRYGVTRA